MNSDHIKAALIVQEAALESRLDMCFAFMRFFAGSATTAAGFDRRVFYRACMHGELAAAIAASPVLAIAAPAAAVPTC